MEDIIIPQRLANILMSLIIAFMGVDVVKWFMRETGLGKDRGESGKKHISVPIMKKVRIFISESLRYLGNRIISFSDRIMR